MEKNKLPIIELDEPTRLWLEEVYHYTKKNKRPTQRQIWSKLKGKIPKDFNPISIDERLSNASGDSITIMGIIAIEKNYSIIKKADSLIFALRDYWDDNPEINEVQVSLIAEKCKIDSVEASIILQLAAEYGRFYRSAGVTPQGIGLVSISIGESGEGYGQYVAFDGLENWIYNYLKHKDENRKKDELFFKSQSPIEEPSSQIGISPIFKSRISNVNSGLCFVLMPFTEEWSNRVYQSLIKQSIEQLGLQCLRADNMRGPIIIEDIWTQINQAAIIIADVTNKNPNVMYELGIVHTLGKPAILVTQDVSTRPFDFMHLRHYEYKDHFDGFQKFGEELKEIIKDVYRTNYPHISRF
jgi:hypothetical protein